MKKQDFPPAVLLLGPEAYERRRIKEGLTAAFAEGAVAQLDLAELTLAAILDDARALSLFASNRLIWVVNAEAALPRTVKSSDEDDSEAESGSGGGDAAPLAAYLKDPTPGVVLVFEAIRFDFEGDDKRKQDRVRKFYSALRDVVELRRYAAHEARAEGESLARRAGLSHRTRGARPAGGSAGSGYRAHRRGDRKTSAVRRKAHDFRGRYRESGAGRARHHDIRAGECARTARSHARAGVARHADERRRLPAARADVPFDAIPARRWRRARLD